MWAWLAFALGVLVMVDARRKRETDLGAIAAAFELTPEERDALGAMAERLAARPLDLAALIQFESGWRSSARNPISNATGLIQWLPSTIESQAGIGVDELRQLNRVQQLALAEQYLSRYAPFPDLQSLAMAVFYPVARDWPPGRQFPERVQRANPIGSTGRFIQTPADYTELVRDKGLRPWRDFQGE